VAAFARHEGIDWPCAVLITLACPTVRSLQNWLTGSLSGQSIEHDLAASQRIGHIIIIIIIIFISQSQLNIKKITSGI